MKKIKHSFTTILLALSALFLFATAGTAGEVRTISKEDLKTLMDKDSVAVIDVRSGRDWSSSEFKIKGAVRIAPGGEFATHAQTYPKDQTIVLYCA